MESKFTSSEWLVRQYLPDLPLQSIVAMSARDFRPYGHDVARKLGGKFVEDPRPGICKNHDITLLILPRQTIRILLHHEFRLLAFARHHEPDEGYGGYDFADAPDLEAALGGSFFVAPKNVLEKPLDQLALQKAVGKDKDIDYWNPKRIGDVLFNFWD